jgi:hypothetical protein
MQRLLVWLGLGSSKFHTWKDRYGKAHEHNVEEEKVSGTNGT